MGEKAEEANPDEAFRQHMQRKSTEKLERADGHGPLLTAARVVLPSKRDVVVSHLDDPMIRDGDAVRVAREVVEDVGRAAKRGFGIYDPIMSKQSSEKRAARRRIGEVSQAAR